MKAQRKLSKKTAKKPAAANRKTRLRDLDITDKQGGALKGGMKIPKYPDC